MKDIIELSSTLLNDFEDNILNQPYEEIRIGTCFIKNSNSIRKVYAFYAQYMEYSICILEKVCLLIYIRKKFSIQFFGNLYMGLI